MTQWCFLAKWRQGGGRCPVGLMCIHNEMVCEGFDGVLTTGKCNLSLCSNNLSVLLTITKCFQSGTILPLSVFTSTVSISCKSYSSLKHQCFHDRLPSMLLLRVFPHLEGLRSSISFLFQAAELVRSTTFNVTLAGVSSSWVTAKFDPLSSFKRQSLYDRLPSMPFLRVFAHLEWRRSSIFSFPNSMTYTYDYSWWKIINKT